MTQSVRNPVEGNKGGFTKALTIAGTLLAILPVLAPVVLTLVLLIGQGVFRFDFLMPAELFPLFAVGGGLLIWSALRARSRRAFILGSFGIALALLVLSQLVAVLTGIANGEAELKGFWFVIVAGGIGVYDLAVLAMSIGGGLLLRDL